MSLANNRPMRALLAVVAVAGLASSGLALSAGSATAAPTCVSDGCYGKDPKATGCDSDARTVAEQGVSGSRGMLQIRYSSTCQALWAKYTAPAGIRQIIGASTYQIVFGRVTIWHEGAKSVTGVGSNPMPGGSQWTGMVISDVKACVGVGVVWGKAEASGQVDNQEDPWYWGPCVEPSTLRKPPGAGGGGGGGGW